ncbi:hypothetical protein L2E82_42486 [Cichorium intybus]|uniref:Uncharacterized protein n=1 Tax=Cichorium intybus TaxID=13427 RepID=A0ACB8ZMB1_CICIN|nr:hypothetical protein L2E82_42486 [Cichorium intybus]
MKLSDYKLNQIKSLQVLKWEDVEIGEPKDGEIRVRNKAIGVNFIDIYFRQGVYKAASMPFTPGMEAVGVVTAVGPGPTGRQVGDVVAYAGNPMGAYAEEQILPAEKVVPVPSSFDPTVAASVMLKGMTAQFLLRRCFKVEIGHTILIHTAAGGVGNEVLGSNSRSRVNEHSKTILMPRNSYPMTHNLS